jgi:hypothetical protein
LFADAAMSTGAEWDVGKLRVTRRVRVEIPEKTRKEKKSVFSNYTSLLGRNGNEILTGPDQNRRDFPMNLSLFDLRAVRRISDGPVE